MKKYITIALLAMTVFGAQACSDETWEHMGVEWNLEEDLALSRSFLICANQHQDLEAGPERDQMIAVCISALNPYLDDD